MPDVPGHVHDDTPHIAPISFHHPHMRQQDHKFDVVPHIYYSELTQRMHYELFRILMTFL